MELGKPNTLFLAKRRVKEKHKSNFMYRVVGRRRLLKANAYWIDECSSW